MRRPAQQPGELFDVVDAEDRVVGQASRSEVHACGLLHRAVHVLWLHPRGELALQRRSYAKDTCPGLLSTSCAGHLDAGEDYLQAAVRELAEELALDVEPRELVEIDRCPAHPDLGQEFVRVYLLRSSARARPSPAEVDALLWRTPAEVDAWATRVAADFSSSLTHLLGREGVREALGLPPRVRG